MREHKCGFLHNNRPAVLLMHPCITIGCQLISPLSKYLKALVLTKKSFHTLRADEKFVHILEKCSKLFVPARYFVPGHDLVARILVKVRCVRGALHLQVHQFFYFFFFFSDQDLWCDWGIEGAVVQALPVKAPQQDIEESCHH